jgi:hypothetical protein
MIVVSSSGLTYSQKAIENTTVTEIGHTIGKLDSRMEQNDQAALKNHRDAEHDGTTRHYIIIVLPYEGINTAEVTSVQQFAKFLFPKQPKNNNEKTSMS